MNLNFISSEVLLPFNFEKHFGMFVYLMNDSDNNKRGLFFGGINGWERLTNDACIRSKVSSPIPSTIEYYYNGSNQTYYPENWNDIKLVSSIFYNEHIDAGTYEVEFNLNEPDVYQWADTSSSAKKVIEWVIKPYEISSDDFNCTLDTNEISFGGVLPNVTSIVCNSVFDNNGVLIEKELVENVDYVIENPTELTIGDNYIVIDFIGDFAKNYSIDSLDVKFEVIEKQIDLPTNLNQVITYDGNIYYPTPDNWDDIKNYCTINPQSEDDAKKAGEYLYTISLNDSTNFEWSDGTSDDKILSFRIDGIVVDEPDFANLELSYNANEQTIYPLNWDDIKNYCTISNNSYTNPGEYIVEVSLNDIDGYVWNSGGNENKSYDWTIQKYISVNVIINDADIVGFEKVDENSYIMTYTPDLINKPFVESVYDNLTSKYMIEGVDYNVESPETFDAGNVSYKISFNDDVYEGLEVIVNLTINKADGYFETEPLIVGDLSYGETISVNAIPNSDGEITYAWYRSSVPFDDDNEGELYDCSEESFIVKTVGDYWRVEVSVAETDNYTSISGQAKTEEPVSKKNISFSFDIDETNIDINLKNGEYILPLTNQPDDCNGVITYSSSEETNGDVLKHDGKYYLRLKSIGETVVTASISGSDFYNYVPSETSLIFNIYSASVAYWGYTPYWDYSVPFNMERERLKDTLSGGELPSNKIIADITNNYNGSSSFVVKSSEYESNPENTVPCNIWWFAIPTDVTLESVVENGNADMSGNINQTLLLKNSDVFEGGDDSIFTITVDDKEYYVYSQIDSRSAYTGTAHKIEISII